MTSFFPDVNVWLALSLSRHVHHASARDWLLGETESEIWFCRLTQLGLLRLLSTEAVMGVDVHTHPLAWKSYRKWFDDDRVGFSPEPEMGSLEPRFERISEGYYRAPKVWTDCYLSAFARSAGFTIVTFDRTFPRAASDAVVVLG